MDNVEVKKNNNFIILIIKSALIALCISLIGILIFAFLLRFFTISDSLINPINQIIKGFSILVGTILGMKRCRQMGFITGFLIGISYIIITFVIFSILDGNFEFSKTLFNDLVFGGIIGGICGVIAVNFKSKK